MSAMFYLSRGGAPEGPFEEARLIYMIQSGELTAGGVCPVGQNHWLELGTVPAFAQALAARAAQAQAPAPGYAQQPPGYGAPAQPQYAQPAAQPQYAQPQYAQPAAQPQYAQTAANAPATKKSNRGLMIAALLGILTLVLVGTAIGAYTLFFSSGGALSIQNCVPQNSELFVEVPSVHQLVADLRDVQYLDTSLRDDKQVFDTASDSITKAFDISQADAIALLASSETFGIAARKLSTTPEAVLALGMKSSSAVETLLKSPRFVASGSVGQTGKRYQLKPKPLAAGESPSVVQKTLSEAELGASGKEGIVWFPNAKLLAIGSTPLLADLAEVVESGAASIGKNASFQAAGKDFPSNARLTLFVDPAVFATISDAKVREIVDAYFKPAGPITASLQVKPAGFVSTLIGHVSGSKLPRSTAFEPAQALNLGQRLPAETFAYMAFSTRSKLTGAEAEKLLLDQMAAVDPHSKAEVEQGLRQLEQTLGVTAAKLVDGAGGQSVLGIATPAGTTFDSVSLGTQALAQLNLTWVLELKDDTSYKQLAAQLKAKLLPGVREAIVSNDGAGFTLTPRGVPLPVSLRVKFLDKYLFVTAGANTLCDRAEAAFSKADHTLNDDPAHKSSLAALPDTQHFLLWVDSGRIGDALLKNPQVRSQLTQSGMGLDKILLTGPNRIVTAVSGRSDVKDEVWTYQVDALNVQALAPLGALGSVLGGAATRHLPGL